MKTPLWQALSAHVAQAPFSTHTPGHKSGQLIPAALKEAWGEAVWHYDLTEVPGLDNLAHPEGVLKESMVEWHANVGAPMCNIFWAVPLLG